MKNGDQNRQKCPLNSERRIFEMSNKEIAAILLSISLITRNVAKKIVQTETTEGSGQNEQSRNLEGNRQKSE